MLFLVISGTFGPNSGRGSSSELHSFLGEAIQDNLVFVCREEFRLSLDSTRRCGENQSYVCTEFKNFDSLSWSGTSHTAVHGMAYFTQVFVTKTVQSAIVTSNEAY